MQTSSRDNWQRGRGTAEKRDELAPFHSITSSASAMREGGTSRPSILAVSRLITSSNLPNRSTGRSTGLAPLRMLAGIDGELDGGSPEDSSHSSSIRRPRHIQSTEFAGIRISRRQHRELHASQDEHGDFPAGTYVRNPPVLHTPGSKPGCTMFVKLCQFDLADTARLARYQQAGAAHAEERDGVRPMPLFKTVHEDVRADSSGLPYRDRARSHGGLEASVLEGGFSEGGENYGPQSWLRLPIGARFRRRRCRFRRLPRVDQKKATSVTSKHCAPWLGGRALPRQARPPSRPRLAICQHRQRRPTGENPRSDGSP